MPSATRTALVGSGTTFKPMLSKAAKPTEPPKVTERAARESARVICVQLQKAERCSHRSRWP